ncbi:MAG: type II toxin-antitoxin system RelE/ParE family toxin [Alphaproteobacteria bacterium]|nr:type II toxin-antitoxin system RelE/ParE family toxin [Alphaproteobacteria bacterium]MBM3653016.1 type II toxin-antitoxin system RelE/ParE family toxin [Alphaproteobacteria bacterium]
MAEFHLSRRARADLLDIYAFTEARFGAYQAEAYYSGLERTFGLLADFPATGVSREEVLARLRQFHFQSHVVFYCDEGNHVLIRALVHVRQGLRPSLFE